MKTFNNILKRIIQIVSVIFPLVIIFIFWKGCKETERENLKKLNFEKKLSFSGKISNYKTDIFTEKSTFILDDSILTAIPRNSKELFLNDGDEITKIKGNNIYIVKRNILWNNESKKAIDTFNFK